MNLPNLQIYLRPGIIDLAWGHPAQELLPVAAMQRATTAALARHGADALTYGHPAGPGALIAWLAERIGQQEGRTPRPEEMLITGGSSHGLDQLLTLCAAPGDVVLVESPTYHLAVRVLRDHPVELIPVPADEEGLQVEVLKQRLVALRRAGKPARLLYTIPAFHNPTGISYSLARRQALVEVATEAGLLLIEDDVYRELAYDAPALPSLWSMAPAGVVARLGSFSKTLAPGVRVGWLTGGSEQVLRLAEGGLLDSGGGINHFSALAVAELCASGDYDEGITRFRTVYRERRNALLAGLAEYLPPGCHWYTPGGGFFTWVILPPELAALDVLPHAEAAGVSFLPGRKFHLDAEVDRRGENALRLAFSFYPPDQLTEGVRRLGAVIREML